MTRNENVLIIGIAGGTGSGKTTLARHIADAFGDRVAVITHDSYYRAQNDKTYEERCLQNYDHPDAFETELLRDHLQLLCQGQAVEVPVYDYTVHNRSNSTTCVQPRAVILLEGILLFSDPALRDMMDLRIFVDTDADERILRRILRDTEERGRSLASVITQYLTTVKPMHEAFVEPYKRYADIIVPGGGDNPAAIDMIVTRIKKQLGE
ncbi:MAG: uridine kinase [Ruminococcaceae bacterium]|nr:uridine kinase [Oscillospiraceae bacterium]